MEMWRDGEVELFEGDDRPRGVYHRKPPRPRGRGRKDEVEVKRSAERLSTFQKLDREMGRFVKAQGGLRRNNGMQGSEEDSSVRGVRHGVKWKWGWMFEQDSLYWDTVRRQNVSGGEEEDSWRARSHGILDAVDAKDGSCVYVCDSSSEFEDDGVLLHPCNIDHDSASSDTELKLRRTHARARKMGGRRKDMKSEVTRGAGKCIPRVQNYMTDYEKNDWEYATTNQDCPAVLEAKCEVLQMEKDLADERLRHQSAEMAQAAEMAHCLRSTVHTILQGAKRGIVSAPCTPGRHGVEDSPGLQQRLQRVQTFNAQRDLEDQAKSFQSRIEKLRQRSQLRSATSCIPKGLNQKVNISSSSSTTQVVPSDGEEWAQVQEVLKQLRGRTGSLQQNCENWEKRAFFAEAKAASLQIEEEKWRVEVQKAKERVEDLEQELVQVKATLEEVRNRHALEQSRLLGSGSNHGYTFVLQPIVTNHGSARCICAVSSDCEGHCRDSGFINHSTCGDHPFAAVSKDATIVSDEISADHEPASGINAMAAPHTPVSEEERSQTSSQCSSGRHRYEGVLEGDWDESPIISTIDAEQSSVHETSKSEVEKSLSQKWFKQRPKSRRTACDVGISEGRSTLGKSPITGKIHEAGRGLSGPNAAVRRVGPVLGGNMKAVPGAFLLEKRAPLKEIKRNLATEIECT